MKKAFTLIELLVVIGIMGLLGTMSVGGYRAMQRGMEERGAMQNVNTLVKAAYERAQIDRLPTAIYFWNETIRAASEDENEVVVGHAVAVRQHGRISRVDGGDLVDEFGDLEKVFSIGGSGSGSEEYHKGQAGSDDQQNTMYLYQLDVRSGSVQLHRSVVSSRVVKKSVNEIYLQIGKLPSDNVGNGTISSYAFQVKDANGASWSTGSAYGLEFAEITLPRNYIFGSSYSKNVEQPEQDAGTMAFTVARNSGSGTQGGVIGSITVYSLRPDGSGGVKAVKVAANDNPY